MALINSLRHHLKEHFIIYAILLIMLIGYFILNLSIKLPFAGVLYWDYARHFQWSYLDSPYMLPGIIKLYSLIFGTSALAFGYIKFLFLTVTTAIIYATAYQLNGKKVGLIAAGMFLSLPAQAKFYEHLDYHLGVIMMLSLVLFFLTRWQRYKANYNLYLGGVFLGCMLMMQFESALVALALLLTSLCIKDYRKLWQTPAFYIALLITFCFVLPFLIWQFNHNWLTIRYLLESNSNQPFGIMWFLRPIWDYIGSLGLYFLLFLIILVRTRFFRNLNANSLFFLLFWFFMTVLLNTIFRFNPIRHTTLLNANMALFLFLSINGYRFFPKMTVIFTILSIIITATYFSWSSRVTYNNDYLALSSLIQPLVKKNTLIISNVTPHDNAPSYFSINLKGQPEVFALKTNQINLHDKGNAAVYIWQPNLKQLIIEKAWSDILILTNNVNLSPQLPVYLKCNKAIPLTKSIVASDSI